MLLAVLFVVPGCSCCSWVFLFVPVCSCLVLLALLFSPVCSCLPLSVAGEDKAGALSYSFGLEQWSPPCMHHISLAPLHRDVSPPSPRPPLQFVPFRDFHGEGDDLRLAEHTLAEIPAQLSSYLALSGVSIPRPDSGMSCCTPLPAPSWDGTAASCARACRVVSCPPALVSPAAASSQGTV